MVRTSRFEIVWNPEGSGGKTRGCRILFESGVKIPDSLAFASNTLKDRDASLLRLRVSEFFPSAKKLIVRSSGNAEDGTAVSMAGKYRSEIVSRKNDTVPEAFFQSVAECALIIWEEMPQKDRANGGVLIQEFFEFEHSGVVFSADPQSSEHAVLAEFSAGGCETLVSGKNVPKRVRFSRIGPLPKIDRNPIPSFDWTFFRDSVMGFERRLGVPVDVEWGWDGTAVIFLQLRPVTSISPETAEILPPLDAAVSKKPLCHYRRLPAAEAFDAPSDEEFLLLENIFSSSAPEVLAKYGIRFQYSGYFTRILGRLYLDVEAEKRAFALAPGSGVGWFGRWRNRANLALVPMKIEWSGTADTFPRIERELLASGTRALEFLRATVEPPPLSEFLDSYRPVFEANFLASSYAAYRKKVPRWKRGFQSRKEPFFGTLARWKPFYETLQALCRGNSLSLSDETAFSSALSKARFRDLKPEEALTVSPDEWLDFLRETGRAISVVWSNVLRNHQKALFPNTSPFEKPFPFARFPERIAAPCFECAAPWGDWGVLSSGYSTGVLRKTRTEGLPARFDEPTVILTDSIPPELAYALPENTTAVVTLTGALLSHFAIVARERGIPVFLCGDSRELEKSAGKPVLVKDSGWTALNEP